METFYRCRCFLTDNYFLKKFRLHVNFYTKEQFIRDYMEKLRTVNCNSTEDLEEVLSEIDKELQRRKSLDSSSLHRRQLIAAGYVPLHPHLYKLSETYFNAQFLDLVELCQRPGVKLSDATKLAKDEHKGERLYSFPVFTPNFCEQFLEEIVHFETSEFPKGRPNTMNNYGILLGEMGFDEYFLNPLREKYLRPLASILYPDWGGASLDSHRAFIVIYEKEGDADLAYHYDNAEVTLNVCLGKDYSSGELYFGKMYDEANDNTYKRYRHQLAWGLMHRARHRHGAMPVDDGKRYNLIIWMRSSTIRNTMCPMCHQVPDLVPSTGYGDGFTKPTVDICTTL